MWDWLIGVAYTAHGYCLSWDPWLIGTHAISDFVIFASYTAIPIAILIFLSRRQGLQLKMLGRFFAAFIFWCGLTHLVGMLTLWFPIYDIQAVVKVITAAISLLTAVVIFRLIPKALAIPSPQELQRANDRLMAEVAAHERTLEELRTTSDRLELRVAERTRSLEDAARHAETLVREIAHRSGNLMSVIAAMARQSAKSAGSPAELAQQLAGRIEGMGRSHALLFRQSWREVDFDTLVREQLAPFVGDRSVTVSGPAMRASPSAAHVLGMAFYELATNSLKYGALSVDGGRVTVTWRTDSAEGAAAPQIVISWSEAGGPPVSKPRRNGWGNHVLTKMTAAPLQGEATLDYDKAGIVWTLRVPVEGSGLSLVADRPDHDGALGQPA